MARLLCCYCALFQNIRRTRSMCACARWPCGAHILGRICFFSVFQLLTSVSLFSTVEAGKMHLQRHGSSTEKVEVFGLRRMCASVSAQRINTTKNTTGKSNHLPLLAVGRWSAQLYRRGGSRSLEAHFVSLSRYCAHIQLLFHPSALIDARTRSCDTLVAGITTARP